MRKALVALCLIVPLCFAIPGAASRQHAVTFGRVFEVKLFNPESGEKDGGMKIRSLSIDGKIKEFTTGEPLEIDEKMFVIRQAYRMEEDGPEPTRKNPPRWKWQKGGWLIVDRTAGQVSEAHLPEFDPYYSAVSWHKDYVAYCGVSGDAEKAYAVVVKLDKGALIHRPIGQAKGGNVPESECPAPQWDSSPTTVTFILAGSEKVRYEIDERNGQVK